MFTNAIYKFHKRDSENVYGRDEHSLLVPYFSNAILQGQT